MKRLRIAMLSETHNFAFKRTCGETVRMNRKLSAAGRLTRRYAISPFGRRETAMRSLFFTCAVLALTSLSHASHAQGESARELSAAKALVARYCAAWSIVDPSERALAVASVWAEQGEYLDSQPVHVVGRDALTAEIVKFQQQFPGAQFRCGGVRAHQGFVGYTWSMVMADGTERFQGMDFGEIDSTGRLARIVSFFDMPQPAP